MACCYSEDCGEYAVTPILLAPCMPTKCCEDPPVCYPCLPRCHKPQLVYCCEKPCKQQDHSCCEHHDDGGDCCPLTKPKSRPTSRQTSSCPPPPDCCPTCCKPVKTKYVIPCYRYEDGRIFQERYVPTRHGRLPMSAYKRNGIQDQMHGYRGAIKYLCSGESSCGGCVHTAVQPLQTIFPRITLEVLPVKRKKDKK